MAPRPWCILAGNPPEAAGNLWRDEALAMVRSLANRGETHIRVLNERMVPNAATPTVEEPVSLGMRLPVERKDSWMSNSGLRRDWSS